MTNIFFFDTYALIEMTTDNPNYDKYENAKILTCDFNLAELYLVLKRNNYDKIENYFEEVSKSSIRPSKNSIIKASLMKLGKGNKNFSLIDCVGYMVAKDNNILFLTGDKEFEGMENVEFVK